MVKKCKYCGKKIGKTLPAPLTCWSCYKMLRTDNNPTKNPGNINITLNSEEGITKTCVM